MRCIFCCSKQSAKSVEHIVPESLGNKHYVLNKGAICDSCNNLFSKFENKAVYNSILGFERARSAIRTKKRKPGKAKLEKMEIEGDKNFLKNFITISGIDENSLLNYNENTNEFQITVKTFDNSEVVFSKLLLKMGIESLYQSQRKIFYQHDFKEAKDFLLNKNNKDWPFTSNKERLAMAVTIPRFWDKFKKMWASLFY